LLGLFAGRGWQARSTVPAVLATLYAANPDAEYFKLSPPGAIEVDEYGRTRFIESERGNHHLLTVDATQKDAAIQAFIALAAAKPARGVRGQ
jgi:hypothetical protein